LQQQLVLRRLAQGAIEGSPALPQRSLLPLGIVHQPQPEIGAMHHDVVGYLLPSTL
jgi:hypothetical protein